MSSTQHWNVKLATAWSLLCVDLLIDRQMKSMESTQQHPELQALSALLNCIHTVCSVNNDDRDIGQDHLRQRRLVKICASCSQAFESPGVC